MDWLNQRNVECGYDEFMRNALTYPPTGQLPPAPDPSRPDCDLYDYAASAALYINPCFNLYHLTDFCPYLCQCALESAALGFLADVLSQGINLASLASHGAQTTISTEQTSRKQLMLP